jgi:hypothetical protein
LHLSHLVTGPAHGDNTGGDGADIVSLLSGMTQLQCLALFDDHCCAQTTHRLLTEAVPALPLLATLALPDGMGHAACLLLAAIIRDGALPLLQRVGVSRTVEVLAEFNSCADRAVFLPSFVVWDSLHCASFASTLAL